MHGFYFFAEGYGSGPFLFPLVEGEIGALGHIDISLAGGKGVRPLTHQLSFQAN